MPSTSLSPGAALQRLLDGNARFLASEPLHPNIDAAHRQIVAAQQEPFALVVCCSDSREVPELIFDCGLGDLFVVRTAGHCIGESSMASVEFGVLVLGIRQVLVLGHSHCGAIAATLQARYDLEAAQGNIPALLHRIRPAMDEAVLGGTPPEHLAHEVMQAHVRRTRDTIAADLAPLMAARREVAEVQVTGGRYDLATGAVTLLTGPVRGPATGPASGSARGVRHT